MGVLPNPATKYCENSMKQAGDELCQAQAQLYVTVGSFISEE